MQGRGATRRLTLDTLGSTLYGMEEKLSPQATVEEARDFLADHLEEGTSCPVCDQYAKTYNRKINSGMARSLIAMYRLTVTEGHGEWIHVPTEIGARSREEGKLAYWSLVEPMNVANATRNPSGMWRLTERGKRFARNQMTVPEYAEVYNGKVRSHFGRDVSINDALGKHFSLADLMAGI